MQLRFAAALLTLALPVLAQTPAATEAENVFYKAFWLEKGELDTAGAMVLYEKFLSMAPDHPKAKVAARSQFALLGRAGQVKEAEAFAQKWGKLIGGTPVVGPSDSGGGAGGGDAANPAGRGEGAAGKGGRGRGAGEGAGAGQPGAGRGAAPATAEQIKELETKIAKAKEEGKTEEVAQLERQLQRARQGGEGPGRGMRGQGGGQGQGRGRGGMNFLNPSKKLAEMTAEELTTFSEGLDRASGFIDRMRENGMEDRAKAMEEGIASIKKAIADKKLEDAQKVIDKLREGGRGKGGE